MNIRKKIDYSELYAALDAAMAAGKSQMELYCAIGKAVSRRSEKGAAVMAAEYLKKQYPDVSGFSPRNVRRIQQTMRCTGTGFSRPCGAVDGAGCAIRRSSDDLHGGFLPHYACPS